MSSVRESRRDGPSRIETDLAPTPTANDTAPVNPIPILRFSTTSLPPGERYAAWRNRDWPKTERIFRTEPSEPFDTPCWESARLGQVMYVYSEISGMTWERNRQDIRVSDYDGFLVNMMVRGEAQGDLDGRAFRQRAGDVLFHDGGRRSLHASSASVCHTLIIPRPVAEAWFAPLHDLHGQTVTGGAARTLLAYAAHVRELLPRLELAEADRLGRMFLELLSVALLEARPASAPPLSAEDVLRKRAEEEIERLLGAEIVIADLCLTLGVSRTRLFAAFRDDGGVQTYIMGQRLEQARVALSDLQRAEPIGLLAYRLGFGDGPHFSRAFKRRYGMTPSLYRKLNSGGEHPPPASAEPS